MNKRRLIFGIVALFILISIGLNNLVLGQDGFNYRNLPSSYKTRSSTLNSLKAQRNNEIPKAFDLTNALPMGYVKDGSIDYTKYIQNGLDKYRKVVMPNFPVLINENGLSLKSNSTIIFNENSKLILKSNSLKSYQILRLWNISNTQVLFPVIVGDRKSHKGNVGEWGMGISIGASNDIEIIHPVVSNCWGDGLYIGERNNTSNNNIKIVNGVFDNNRRNGISIVSVNGLQLISPVVSNTNGVNPQCGIDIEPNHNNDVINNVYIKNPITFNNNKHGILLSFSNFAGKSRKNVSININNHLDDGSLGGLRAVGVRDNFKGAPLSGNINIVNPKWINNKEGFKPIATKSNPSINIRR